MYQLDYETCTALDIIERSIVMHPTTFADVVEAQEKQHRAYGAGLPDTLHGRTTARAVKSMADACRIVVGAIKSGDGDAAATSRIIASDTGPLVVALNAACKLQCLPPHVRTAALVRTTGEA